MEYIDEGRIFIVVSQTGTMLSRILKILTGAKYNHASISFFEDLELMYSFGRLNPYNPFHGGFVEESPNFGTFKRFKNTDILVLSIDVGNKTHDEIYDAVQNIKLHREEYHYNYRGLFLATFRFCIKNEKHYYCSEFIRDILQEFDIDGSKNMPDIVKPIDFLKIPAEVIYEGKLKNYKIKNSEFSHKS
ncbi:MAG: hypothetical protein IKT38_06440 [Clostridia bacterium]|nr:hypothetical protein [Clostridia bacterium]